MKLTDLNPRWINIDDDRKKVGLTFDCPHCGKERIAVFFKNPSDGGPAHGRYHPWTRTGDTFNNLSLDLSISTLTRGHWHGHITNGEILE